MEDIVYVNYAGSVGGLDTGNCPSPVLPPTSVSDYTFMNENLDDNYKPSCLFYPPPENYMQNAAQDSFNNTASEEHIHHRDQFTENYPITHRDQYTGCDMTTLGAKDNNLDNHNYDTGNTFPPFFIALSLTTFELPWKVGRNDGFLRMTIF